MSAGKIKVRIILDAESALRAANERIAELQDQIENAHLEVARLGRWKENALGEIATKDARIRKLQVALQPFAELAMELPDHVTLGVADGHVEVWVYASEIRAAHSALDKDVVTLVDRPNEHTFHLTTIADPPFDDCDGVGIHRCADHAKKATP